MASARNDNFEPSKNMSEEQRAALSATPSDDFEYELESDYRGSDLGLEDDTVDPGLMLNPLPPPAHAENGSVFFQVFWMDSLARLRLFLDPVDSRRGLQMLCRTGRDALEKLHADLELNQQLLANLSIARRAPGDAEVALVAGVQVLVERFDIEPLSDFSAK